jgi:flavin-dependent dehydrogenase
VWVREETMSVDLASPREVVVVGAGPAGAFASRLLAQAGVSTLLVERKSFPRQKVCGGCINAHAWSALEAAGLSDRVRDAGAQRIDAIRLHHGGAAASIALPKGVALSRAVFDQVLVDAAVDAGCEFVSETAVLVSPEGTEPLREGWRRVTLQRRHEKPIATSARVVVVADGLSHSSLRECSGFRSRVSGSARIGVGALLAQGSVVTAPHTVTMAVGRAGYVGTVDVEGGLVNLAAAVDAKALKAMGGPWQVVAAILAESGLEPGVRLEAADWAGTVALTRRLQRPVARRVFVIGDASGYIEPFTGEGIAWAMAAARAVVPFVREGLATWTDGLERRWLDTVAGVFRRDQRWCRVVSTVLRSSWATHALVRTLGPFPGLARPLVAHMTPRPVSLSPLSSSFW